jgi:hypothetical protein
MRSEGKVICQPARPYPSHSSPASHPCHPVPPWPSCCLRPVLFTQIICFGIEPRISRLARTKKAYFPSVKSLKSVVTMLSIRVPSKSPPIAGQIRPTRLSDKLFSLLQIRFFGGKTAFTGSLQGFSRGQQPCFWPCILYPRWAVLFPNPCFNGPMNAKSSLNDTENDRPEPDGAASAAASQPASPCSASTPAPPQRHPSSVLHPRFRLPPPCLQSALSSAGLAKEEIRPPSPSLRRVNNPQLFRLHNRRIARAGARFNVTKFELIPLIST